MANNDTINLLKECDAGAKMAISSIDEVLDKVQDPKLTDLLNESRDHHAKLENEIHTFLTSCRSEDKDPGPIAKSMSWFKTNLKLGMDDSDATIADLLTDGCNMGIKSLMRYMNQYQEANNTSRDVCKRLIRIEEKLREKLRDYL